MLLTVTLTLTLTLTVMIMLAFLPILMFATSVPTHVPTEFPSEQPTYAPSKTPTELPTEMPTEFPSEFLIETPSAVPTELPIESPSETPSAVPTEVPTTYNPTESPTTETPTTETPTETPTEAPTETPTEVPTIRYPDLNRVLRNAQPGDIIEFEEFIQPIKTYVHGTAEQPITIRGVGSSAVISGEQKSDFTQCVTVMHDHYIFENFDVRHCDKGIMSYGASHGVLRRIVAQSIAQEAFHLLDSSQFWLLVRCTARANSDSSMIYGEGFYMGSARTNWLNDLEPDATSYVTVKNCQAVDTNNDGFDVKEGAHHIRFIRCKASWPSGPPRGDPSVGNSGWFIRANYVQLVDCQVQDLQGGFPAVFVNGIRTGSDVCGAPYVTRGVELKGLMVRDVSGDNRTSSALFYYSNYEADALVLYTDFDFQRVQGGDVYQPLNYQLRWPVLKDPAEFELMSWDTSVACRQLEEWTNTTRYKRGAKVKQESTVYKSKRNNNRRNIKSGKYWERLSKACVELHRPGKRCACVGAWTRKAAFRKGDRVNFQRRLYQAKRKVNKKMKGNPRKATRHWQYLDQCI